MSAYSKVIVIIDGIKEEKELIQKQNGFDGETGKPVMEYYVANGFDGMTGEPVYTKVVQDGYDADTGAPVFIFDAAAESMDEYLVSVPPKAEISKRDYFDKDAIVDRLPVNKLPIMIGAIVACVLLVAFIVYGGVKNGTFLGKHEKVAMAIANTIKDDSIGNAVLGAADVLNSSELSLDYNVDAKAEGVRVEVNGVSGMNTKKALMGGSADVSVMGFSSGVDYYFDDTKMQLSVPDIYDDIFEYNYTVSNDGAIADFLYDEAGVELDDVNRLIVEFSNMIKKSPAFKKKLSKELYKAYKEIEVNKIDKESFEVDGKDRKCKGYSMTIKDKNLKAFVTAYMNASKEAYGDSYDEILDIISDITGEDIDVEDELEDELDYYFEDIGSCKINFYIYKGKLAAITTKVGDEKVKIEFKGGDTRTSNIRVKAGDISVKKESSIKKGKEVGTIDLAGYEIEYSYDTKSGAYEIEDSFNSFDGVFDVKKGKNVTVSFSGNSNFGIKGDAEFVISKGCKVSELKGDVFDVGDASKSDIIGLAAEIGSNYVDVLGGLEDLF